MTPVELAVLRNKVARARLGRPVEVETQRAIWRDDKRRWRSRRSKWCLYCGDTIRNSSGQWERGLACAAHSDLPALDPAFGAHFLGSVTQVAA